MEEERAAVNLEVHKQIEEGSEADEVLSCDLGKPIFHLPTSDNLPFGALHAGQNTSVHQNVF